MPTRNLAIELLELLQRHSQEHAERWKALFMDEYTHWNNALPLENDQISTINEFWRIQLGMLEIDTIQVRSYLIDDISPDFWMDNFKRYILDTVLQHTLPWHKHQLSVG